MKELIYHRLLLPAVAANADRPCATNAGTGVGTTFAEHLHNVSTTIGGLQSLGVGRGDRFAVMTLNSVEYLELYHAAFLGGGVVNPLNLRFAPKELAYVLRDSGTKVCFVDAIFANLIDSVKEEAGLEHVVLVGGGDVPHTVRHADLLAAADAVIPDEGEETDPVVLMYTGGTTGLPKGVLLDQRAEMLNAYHVFTRLQFDRSTVNLIQTPMFHAASMFGVLGGPAQGAHSVIQPMFEPTAVMKTVRAYQPTSTVMVPTMIGMTMAHPDFTPDGLSSFTDLVYGASPMPQALLEKLLALYPDTNIWQGYGMTESSSVLSFLGPDEHRAGGKYLRSAGKPAMGVVFSIQDDHGNLLPVGTPGEVCARAGNFMIEYWNKPEATTEAFRGGWYHSGDAGYLDSDGYLYLVDRVKDMIVTGGENVYSTEVENAVASHAAVLQVAVIGIPSEQWGEAVHAVVVLKEGLTATAAELIDHCREWIAGYKLPKSVEFRTEPLPLSGAMKVLKKDLREPYWEGHDRKVN
ncbi:MAG: AMP-binding protein [Ilumatobacteraceae bacterium]|jgi:long-chain acyl-CoA synthetase|nr:AMP-binding protein [Acidimicrobiaceae bacterium]MBP6487397.1 AMP-binding protein [Ilumatobacteraceae bacterium]MBP7888197.1 AMP-binding protein [Ilumatobacteraceae bacterium]MBP8210475.1 AMP-binding protein [Ilumatobacteraceae bacterium]MBP9052764.1 AMP-binding protein [Ilumatobacteraceae bacterium]